MSHPVYGVRETACSSIMNNNDVSSHNVPYYLEYIFESIILEKGEWRCIIWRYGCTHGQKRLKATGTAARLWTYSGHWLVFLATACIYKVPVVLGSTPALVNPTLAVGYMTTGGGSLTPAMNLHRELGGSDAARGHTPPKVSSRSVHGTVSIRPIS